MTNATVINVTAREWETTPASRAISTSRTKLASLLATAALTGAIAMGLEMVAFRLYAPYFGYSVYVWGTMISVVMAALAVGYAAGGRLAENTSAEPTLYGTILFSAAYQLLILWCCHPLLRYLSRQSEFTGTAVATFFIFGPSMAALASTGPMILRFCARFDQVGSAAGRVYALSTVGSTTGILLTSFFLVPRFGTQATLKALCLVSFAAAVSGLALHRRAWLLSALPAMGLLIVPGSGWSQGAVWTAESAYNLIRVMRSGDQTALVLNNNRSVHTIQMESEPWTGYYYDYFALGPKLVRANRALVLGMGAGGSIRAMRSVAPELAIDAVEIDPKVVDAAHRWFGLSVSDPHLQVYVDDARPWLAKKGGVYEIVQLDLYQGGPYIPFYLVTSEFFRLVRAHMTGDGVVMMNVFDPSPKGELLGSIAATMAREFPSLMQVRISRGNHMLFGFANRVNVDDLRTKLVAIEGDERLVSVAEEAASQIAAMQPLPGTLIFTDDRAPVEEITRRVLAD